MLSFSLTWNQGLDPGCSGLSGFCSMSFMTGIKKILEDDDWCTPGSASLFDIPHSLGYQVFSPSMPLRRVPGCQTKHFVSDLLLLKNEFVKTIGDKLDNEPEIHLEGERIGPPKF